MCIATEIISKLYFGFDGLLKWKLKYDSFETLAETKECRVSEIRPADYVIVTHSKGKFLAYVTQAQQYGGKFSNVH